MRGARDNSSSAFSGHGWVGARHTLDRREWAGPTRTDPRLEVSSHYCTTLTGNCCRRVPRRAAPAPCRMYNFTPRELFTSRGIIWPFITARRINFDGEMVIILPHSSSSHAHNKSPPFSAVFSLSLSLSLMLICSHLPISAVRSWSRSHGRVLAADEEREGSREGHACFLHIPSGRCGSKVKTRHRLSPFPALSGLCMGSARARPFLHPRHPSPRAPFLREWSRSWRDLVPF